MTTGLKYLILCWCCMSFITAHSQKVLNIVDFGGAPDSRKDVMKAVRAALDACKGKTGITLRFPKGRYDFYPIEPKKSEKNVGLILHGLKDIEIDGCGSDFVFHGWMEVARIVDSENIVMKNFTTDWDRPFISQAVIAGVSDSYLDLKIDAAQYPYKITNGELRFYGEDWESGIGDRYNNLYDKGSKEIVYNTWDSPLKDFLANRAEDLGNGMVRLHGTSPIKPEIGTYLSLYHFYYAMNGITILNSKDIKLEDITLYHTLSCGVWGEHSENITMKRTSTTVNERKGRVFSTVADASHFNNCKGTILVEECAHTGQGDDFINVHGRNVKIGKKTDKHTLELENNSHLFDIGDEIWLVNHQTGQRDICLRITGKEMLTWPQFKITLDKEIPDNIGSNDYVENKTWSAAFVMRNCKVLKRNRARGVLVTTPKKVIIENNYFKTAGTALLIEGDLDHWYESGACTDVLVRNNTFDNCLTSGNKTGNRWEWGDAVITITPSQRPADEKDIPFHRNIRIRNNRFRVFDAPIVRARSVDGLKFVDNRIEETTDYKPYTWQKSSFLLDGCRNVIIRNNKWDKNYTKRIIEIEHMHPSDIHGKTDKGFDTRFVSGFNTYLN